MIPPVVGPATVATSSDRAHIAIAEQSRSVSAGCWRTWNFSKYSDEWRPDARMKCPSRSAPESRKTRSTSADAIVITTILREVKIHDVSLVLRPDMVTWPGEPAPRIEPLKRISRGDGNNVSIITLGDHTGTHVDPPLHFIEGGNTVDKLPLDALVGPCRVLGFEGPGHVSSDWLESQKVPRGTERLLFKTPNSARWAEPTAAFTRDFTTINASAARWC